MVLHHQGEAEGRPSCSVLLTEPGSERLCNLPDVTQQICVAKVGSWDPPPRWAGVQVGLLKLARKGFPGGVLSSS